MCLFSLLKYILVIFGTIFLGILWILYSFFSAAMDTGSDKLSAQLNEKYEIRGDLPGYQPCEKSLARRYDDDKNVFNFTFCSPEMHKCQFFANGLDKQYKQYFYLVTKNGTCLKMPIKKHNIKNYYIGHLSFGKQYLLDMGISEKQIENTKIMDEMDKEQSKGKINGTFSIFNKYNIYIKYDKKVEKDQISLYGKTFVVEY